MGQNLKILTSYLQNEFGFDVFLDDKTASTYNDHRSLLRKNLYKKTKNKTVFDLNAFPNIEPKCVSISHCPVMGGFVISDQAVGFDLEQFQRVSPTLIRRISKAEEQTLFSEQQLKAIWTIKESVFKCEKSFDSNIPSVSINSVEELKIDKFDFEIIALKSKSHFKTKTFETLSFICPYYDLVLSLSYKV